MTQGRTQPVEHQPDDEVVDDFDSMTGQPVGSDDYFTVLAW